MTVSTELKKTPIYERHASLGAKIVDFHGWLMPLQYKGIIAEHLAVRRSAGIFDVSHMGTIEISGKDAYVLSQYLVTNNLDKIGPNRTIYAHLCNEKGGIIDDLIVYMFSKEKLIFVVNASNLEKDFNWIISHKGNYNVAVKNLSDDTVLIALQGPMASKILEKFLGQPLSDLKRLHFKEFSIQGNNIIVSRTGYTGEDGFELFINKKYGIWLWDSLMKFKPEPVGLGARDTLRLEKGYTLYGNDINDSTTPLEAGLAWVVDFKKKEFIGREALLKHKPARRLVRLEMLGTGIPRQGCAIFHNGGKIGAVTSGTYCPSSEKGIAMGYIKGTFSEVEIDIRGRLCKAKIVV